MKLYTKVGDQGTTGLLSGKRVQKDNERIQLYGMIDTLNSHLGYFISLIDIDTKMKTNNNLEIQLHALQNTLFVVGGLLASEEDGWKKFKLPLLEEEIIKELEKSIDQWSEDVPPLKNFILPGGNSSASYCHVVRSYTREVERFLVTFISGQKNSGNTFSPEVLNQFSLWSQFFNRLSDYFFALNRKINHVHSRQETLYSVK